MLHGRIDGEVMRAIRLLAIVLLPGIAVAAAARTTLHAGGAGTVVSGTVSGSDQGFLTGASVVIDGPEHRDTRTDADGRFTFAGVPRGRFRIVISAEGYMPLDRPLEVGDASVSVDIVLLRLPGVQ
jgi:hypothetical protein